MSPIDPKLRATIEVGVSGFAVGFLTYLDPLLQGGVMPSRSAWGSIVVNALVAGGLMAYHRLYPSPTQKKKPDVQIVAIDSTAFAVDTSPDGKPPEKDTAA